VAIGIAQRDASWQRSDIDAVRSGERHLQQTQLRRCRKSTSPSSGQQHIRIGECGSPLCRFIVIEDFGTDVGSDEFNDGLACEAASVPRNSAFIGGSSSSDDRFV
jgi:hypothetical protein